MEKLTKEETLHVASLARLKLTKDEEEKYARELYMIFNEINKIKDLDIDGDIMISPSNNQCALREDNPVNSNNCDELIENAPLHELGFIEVAGVFDE